MRIAILSSGSLRNKKGVMNYVHEKAKLMQELFSTEVEIDVFLIHQLPSALFRILVLRKSSCSHLSLKNTETYDGVVYHYIYYRYGLNNYLLDYKIGGRPIGRKEEKRILNLLSDYDVIASHSPLCHYIAKRNKNVNRKPYVATWHGSDINVYPYKNHIQFKLIQTALENADMNLFVSNALMKASEKITKTAPKRVLYTGPSRSFHVMDVKAELHSKYGDGRKYVIGFAGNLIPIKNVQVLPAIFNIIAKALGKNNVQFVIAGNGILEGQIRKELNEYDLHVKWIGMVEPSVMPEVMNSLDLLILPSLNEGLPLVILEARSCGVHVVGSDSGGIPEAIGNPNNCFPLNESFVSNIATRIVEILENDETPLPLPETFSWESAMLTEKNIYKTIKQKNK